MPNVIEKFLTRALDLNAFFFKDDAWQFTPRPFTTIGDQALVGRALLEATGDFFSRPENCDVVVYGGRGLSSVMASQLAQAMAHHRSMGACRICLDYGDSINQFYGEPIKAGDRVFLVDDPTTPNVDAEQELLHVRLRKGVPVGIVTICTDVKEIGEIPVYTITGPLKVATRMRALNAARMVQEQHFVQHA